ncbi:MAG: histidinol-phosphatase [Victivallales bacterium]|nr:histidinol-phosphatase [Victivallales bacterium]
MLNGKFPNGVAGYSYHNHSNFSDGKNTPEEMLLAARAAGIREYGFSDHWVVAPDYFEHPVAWSIKRERIYEYLDTVKALKAKYTDDKFSVKVGLEVDYFEENIEDVAKELRSFELDYAIGASHFVGKFPVDGCEDYWKPLNQAQIDEVIEGYWQKMEKVAACPAFDIIAHLDLCKIFCYASTRDTSAHVDRILELACKTGKAVEINTAGWDKKCGICYPAPAIIAKALAMGVHFVISADAHKTEHINRYFDQAVALLKPL